MAENIKITVNLDNMTIGDLELLDKAGADIKGVSMAELVSFLDRVVEEDVRAMPIATLRDVVQALMLEVKRVSNPEDSEGKN